MFSQYINFYNFTMMFSVIPIGYFGFNLTLQRRVRGWNVTHGLLRNLKMVTNRYNKQLKV